LIRKISNKKKENAIYCEKLGFIEIFFDNLKEDNLKLYSILGINSIIKHSLGIF
jgi:hypothetical protein